LVAPRWWLTVGRLNPRIAVRHTARVTSDILTLAAASGVDRRALDEAALARPVGEGVCVLEAEAVVVAAGLSRGGPVGEVVIQPALVILAEGSRFLLGVDLIGAVRVGPAV
jgi:hypothetical protein